MGEFSSTDLDRLLADARATLDETRAGGQSSAGKAADELVTALNAALDGLTSVPSAQGDGDVRAPRDLAQVEQLTQAINEALGRIG